MKKVALAEIVEELENGSRPEGGVNDSGDVFSVGGEHLNDFGGFDFSNAKLISHDFYSQMKRGKVKPDDIIIVKDGATTGKTSFVNEQFPHFPCAINEHVFRLAVNQKVADPKYVFYYLYSPKGNKEILDDFRGATVGGISQEFVNKVFIPLPPLDEQKRIASLLARADRLRQLRRHARHLADSLLQSVFLEMFGEPKTNPKGWDYEIVDELCELVRGSSPRPQGDPRFFGGNVPRLMVADITRDGMYVTPQIDSLTELGAKQSRPMKAGDVVMVVSGIVGLPAILKIDACIHDGFVGFRNLDKRILSTYFYFLLLFMQQQNSKQAAGAIWQNLTTDQIREWKIPLPPLPLQEEFARVAARVEALRARQAEAERQAEGLFQSLLAESFTPPQPSPNPQDLGRASEGREG